MSDTYAVVMTTTDDVDLAKKISNSLVSRKLAACVQLLKIESVYEWKGEINSGDEILLFIKCKSDDFIEIEKSIKSEHNYEEPEIILINIQKGSESYFRWIHTMTSR